MTDNPDLDAFTAQLGAFARVFREDSAEAIADRFVDAGLRQVQLNFSAIGYPSIPDPETLARIDMAAIAAAFASRGLRLWGLSGTYNMAHPDAAAREADTARAAGMIAGIGALGVEAVTLCTGSRDPENMWRRHPGNASESAWSDFRRSLDALLPAAAEGNVLLAIEPEPGNVVSGTRQALRLLDELGADAGRIGFILDAANLVDDAPREDHMAILEEAFAALGPKTLCVHGKDPNGWQEALDGRPGLDHESVLDLYRGLPRQVPYIIQDTTPAQLPLVRDLVIQAYRS